MNPRPFSQITPFALLFAAHATLTGCAGSAGSVTRLEPGSGRPDLSRYPNLAVEVSSSVPQAGASDTARIRQHIVRVAENEHPGCFQNFTAAPDAPQTVVAQVNLRRYEEGSAFARFMLAGLGQMHIDADLGLQDGSTAERIARYDITKTFAWGGIYGAVNDLRDIEEGFAKAVASALCERGEQ
ncbi:MAG: hypothetical protein FIA97_09215 [Methylococcaceae bacterium]|nr:hypothetical protein [Methylococcaceae bacterium]